MATTWNASPKDPDAIRDYGINWAADIGSDTIVTSTWEVVSGTVTIVDDDHTTTTTTVRLAGGTAGETCEVKNHIVLADGQEDDYTGEITIAQR